MPPLLRLLRPQQWTKNLICFAGAVFGDRLRESWAIGADAAVFLVFCAISSALYVFNDVRDLDHDRVHPTKRLRPLPSGEVDRKLALAIAGLLGIVALVAAACLGWSVLICVALYAAINLLYSLRLKHLVLLDVCCIATGFVLRLLAGIFVLHDVPTTWIVLCTLFLALFLAAAKRHAELQALTSDNQHQRPVLADYRLPFLDSLLTSSATMTVLSYALFTATSGKNPTLVLTVPIVYYAVMHYKYLVTVRGNGTDPERLLYADPGIRWSIVIWLLGYGVIYYGRLHLFR